jgi:hypothetical protein
LAHGLSRPFFGAALVALGLVFVAFAMNPAPAAASHAWGNYHWPNASDPAAPFTINLGDNLTKAEWEGFLGSASADWTVSDVLDAPVVAGYDGNPKRCRPVPGRDQVCNAKYGLNGWLGLAQIWTSGSHIQQGTVKVNDSYFQTARYNDPNAKRHVMCQEVGHTFGLDHQRSATSLTCMDDQNGIFDPLFVSPNQHDYDELHTIYTSHNDSTSTAPLSVTGSAAGVKRASETLYVQDFGHGRRLFTWVLWKDRAARDRAPTEPPA